MSNAPTLINLPPPPSDPVTPSDVPGTPNSTTTSMSELSTVAIKDGHRGHLPHHHAQQNPMDAERADRISRLAGLERVTAGGGRPSNLNPSSAAYGHHATGSSGSIPPMTQGYFDANNQPQIVRERSTVGSASATGSVGGRTTTWASGSDVTGYDPSLADRMSEDQEMETASSVGGNDGFSDVEGASLVGFGEGARTPARGAGSVGSPVVGKATTPTSAVPGYMRGDAPPSPMTGVSSSAVGGGSGASTPSTEAQVRDAQRIDGITYDAGVTDTTARTPPPLSGEVASQQQGAANAAQWINRQAEHEQGRQ
ncbi:hypothetical protein BFW01_g11247 [Lasiodiplodia theobromae]|uniref:Uncharacterized protein n=2 Tax=Lasiodiplodia TaxID=66739 RepID=A0A5N5DEB2_9PEZI|nr:Membrane-associated eicosanoid glutathione metabolism protein [Lasiodiplodia theobromae]KAB2575790.1 hypothetical protein DBV05_g5671 [Lasiodiplodia theobromae]KAF4537590.1 Membrane-associated eicosanoid glutathione metabolism protein [Lasiodiplodia theobromae]KAF9639441.1 hypothetical protein BFW01_g11247 [Lasiodiplodia theobromae]KAK0642441.1 hypothetical protein DIS24_g9069 [Lasiodiplodia hormozganensis]